MSGHRPPTRPYVFPLSQLLLGGQLGQQALRPGHHPLEEPVRNFFISMAGRIYFVLSKSIQKRRRAESFEIKRPD